MIENTEEKAVIRALWDYFMQCPVMAAGKINVDYLPAECRGADVEYSCCFSKRMRKLFRKNEKSVLRFCNKSSKTKRAFTKVLMPCKRPF